MVSLIIKIHGYVSQCHLLFIVLTVPKQITHKDIYLKILSLIEYLTVYQT